MPQTQTMPIIPRRVDFTFDEVQLVWLADSVKTQFMQALSLFIPTSERIVIDILRKHQVNVDDQEIQLLITDLIKQEGQHAAMHRRANCGILKQHPELKWVMTLQAKFMGLIQSISSQAFQLAIPVAFEHVTAAISKDVLSHKKYWMADDVEENAARDFLLWHCLEELEHQSACHVIYRHTYKHSFKHNARIILSLLFLWLPVTSLSIFCVQFYLLMKDKTLLKPRNWLPFIGFTSRTCALFVQGLFKYRKKDNVIWSDKEIALYESAREEYNLRQYKP